MIIILVINGNTITLTKGDTLDVEVQILRQTGEDEYEEYTPVEGDSIRFALKSKYTDPEPLILKDIPIQSMRLRLESDETKTLKPGKVPYVYDIQLTMLDGTVDTFIDRQKFYVTEEVD